MKIRPFEIKDKNVLNKLFQDLAGRKILINSNAIIDDERCHCHVLENDKGEIIGSATLAFYQGPVKGLTGVVEDVIIDENYRGQGLGRMIMNKLIEVAEENNLRQITLTSNSSRTSARKLYQSLGFEICDTGFFKKVL